MLSHSQHAQVIGVMKKKNDDDSGVLLNACHVSLSLYLIMILIYRGVCVGYQWDGR